jgi:hypothetical protein
MFDLIMVALAVAAFALAVGYARCCSRVIAPAADRDRAR